MAKKYFIGVFIGFILLFVTSNAHAWDDQRKGFLLGIGIGAGHTSYTQKVTWQKGSFELDRENKAGVMTDFKIGYAPDNSWAIYYTSKTSWFGMTNALGNDVTIANGLRAVAVSYWFNPQTPSPFIAGGIGFSTWSCPFEYPPQDTWRGPGLFAGGGYEFLFVSVEGYLVWGKPKHKEYGTEVSSNALSLMFTVNFLGY